MIICTRLSSKYWPYMLPLIIPSICDLPAAPSTRLKNVVFDPSKVIVCPLPTLNFVQSRTADAALGSAVAMAWLSPFADTAARVACDSTALLLRNDVPASTWPIAMHGIRKRVLAFFIMVLLYVDLHQNWNWTAKYTSMSRSSSLLPSTQGNATSHLSWEYLVMARRTPTPAESRNSLSS